MAAMIDRILYAAVIAALASVVAFDPIFTTNLLHALGEPGDALPLNIWELGVAGMFAALIVAALVRGRRRW